jgi:large subunit ribosomal protein L18
VIDDTKQHTLAAASTLDPNLKSQLKSGATSEAAIEVGKLVAQRAIEQGIGKVVFDRGGNLYHGRIKALADAAREAGLDF